MTTQAVILIIISAILHAGWNLVVKKYDPTPSFFLLANSLGVIIFAPFLWLTGGFLPALTFQIWLLLTATGLFMALYMYSLARAYDQGTMSAVYPTVRALPIILTTLVLFLFMGTSFSLIYLLGILMIISGLYLNWGKKTGSNFLAGLSGPAAKYVFFAGVGTAGYSLIDAEGMNLIIALDGFSAAAAALTYIVYQGFFASLWLAAYLFFYPRERKKFRAVIKNNLNTALLVGAGIYITYILVLASMLFADNVGYIVAFRQAGILIGGLLAWLILKETFEVERLMGIIILLAGLIMVALG